MSSSFAVVSSISMPLSPLIGTSILLHEVLIFVALVVLVVVVVVVDVDLRRFLFSTRILLRPTTKRSGRKAIFFGVTK